MTYAHVCPICMDKYAHACTMSAQICTRMHMYAHVYADMHTYAQICCTRMHMHAQVGAYVVGGRVGVVTHQPAAFGLGT